MEPASSAIPASLETFEGQMRQVWAEAAGVDFRPRGVNRVADAFAQAGDRLVGGTADPLSVAQAGLLRQFGPIDLPWVTEPDISVIFHARDGIASTVGVIRSLARGTRLEVVMLDDSQDPRTALLRGIAPNLVIFNAPGGSEDEAALRATTLARGRAFAMLDDTVKRPSATALAALSSRTGAVVIGPAIMERAARTGMSGLLGAEHIRAEGRLGLLIHVGAKEFAQFGGSALNDVALLDFCLRARAAGVPVPFHDEPAGGPTWTR